MKKPKNLGGFITIPIPAPENFPMSFDEYKKRYGLDLTDILEGTESEETHVKFKVNKPLLGEDVDDYYIGFFPKIAPIISFSDKLDDDTVLVIMLGVREKSGIGFQVKWNKKTLIHYEI